MIGGDERPHLRALRGRVADLYALHRALEERHEPVESASLDKDARPCAAVLPGVAEKSCGSGGRGCLQVRVGEDDVRGLAAKLQGYALDRTCCGGHDPAPYLGRAGKGDLRYVRVLGETLPDRPARSRNDVHDALR